MCSARRFPKVAPRPDRRHQPARAVEYEAKLDAARALEPELSEEAYEDYLASKARPPASVLALTASAFVLVSLFCLTYEFLRGALRRALKDS